MSKLSRIAVAVLIGAAGCGQAPTSSEDLVEDGPNALAADATCHEVDEWLEAHPDALPTNLEALSEFAAPHRRRIFAKLDPFARAKIAADVLDRRLRTGGFDPEQVRLLQHLRAHATPQAFSDVNLPATRERVASWRRDAEHAFTDPELYALFSGFDAELPPTKALSGSATGCGCSTQSDFCSTGMACAGISCQGSTLGCGWFFLYPCDGICAYIKNPGRPWGPPVPA